MRMKTPLSEFGHRIFAEVIAQGPKEVSSLRINLHNWEKDQVKEIKTGDKPEIVKFDPLDKRLAEKLYELMQVNFPSMKSENLDSWAEDINKLARIDKQEYSTIEAAIAWTQAHGFWKRNIRSGAALRKHFEKVCIQAKFDNEQKKGKIHSV